MFNLIKIFEEKSGSVQNWINKTIAEHEGEKIPVSERKFKLLSKCFSSNFLKQSSAVYVSKIPLIPFSQIGLDVFAEMESDDVVAITYLNCFFTRQDEIDNEVLHFHELIHVLQWNYLGMEKFLFCYGLGLLEFGYRQSPLEVMAYNHESKFKAGNIYDVENAVIQEMQFFDKLLEEKKFEVS